jgi:hypothetical protein
MDRIKYIALAILMFGIGSCNTTAPEPNLQPAPPIITPSPHPIEPQWKQFTRKPVVSKIEQDNQINYIVSDEYMERSLQMVDYTERIKQWKLKNLIP